MFDIFKFFNLDIFLVDCIILLVCDINIFGVLVISVILLFLWILVNKDILFLLVIVFGCESIK